MKNLNKSENISIIANSNINPNKERYTNLVLELTNTKVSNLNSINKLNSTIRIPLPLVILILLTSLLEIIIYLTKYIG